MSITSSPLIFQLESDFSQFDWKNSIKEYLANPLSETVTYEFLKSKSVKVAIKTTEKNIENVWCVYLEYYFRCIPFTSGKVVQGTLIKKTATLHLTNFSKSEQEKLFSLLPSLKHKEIYLDPPQKDFECILITDPKGNDISCLVANFIKV